MRGYLWRPMGVSFSRGGWGPPWSWVGDVGYGMWRRGEEGEEESVGMLGQLGNTLTSSQHKSVSLCLRLSLHAVLGESLFTGIRKRAASSHHADVLEGLQGRLTGMLIIDRNDMNGNEEKDREGLQSDAFDILWNTLRVLGLC
eukprot:764005-Hanusia_phi.AAC.1